MPKAEGSIRICGDIKVTIHHVLEVDPYPLPEPEDIFSTLAGGQKFTKLDLASAYQQVLLDGNSRPYVTINTHKGLYRYTRLPFGIASAPAVLQNVMDRILQGLPVVACYLDGMLITEKDDQEHLHNLELVLERLQTHRLPLKKDPNASSCSHQWNIWVIR